MSKLAVKNISVSFGTNKVLDNVSLEVNEGEFTAILGPSGSGKSTLFSLVGGILAQDEGHIYLDGKLINGKQGFISYMPQSPALFPWRTVLQNVLLGQELHGKTDKQTAIEMLITAGLSDYEKAFPHELSGGMKQRAAFIRALLSPQTVMCLDEPFSALDEFTRLDMQKWLLSIWEIHRKTILFITHNIEEALFLADRIIVLSDKPASIAAEFRVPFPRPRKESLLLNESFLQWKRTLYHTLRGGEGHHE
ncbi:ABC transporter ATP-binding protein [Bacillus sp. V3-13]|uniref:ABC transporter ATP-binding protein n=1 Tax=Bacillus sp. V3-13 TaxID=2053728 RepID=UPI000C78B7AB|nr:ABC transporter ATP-binding protein [Bacillus sp. V3-13]PLR78651.1 ABC transporter ATP-binding protein [Bacillus sp. V3-13]